MKHTEIDLTGKKFFIAPLDWGLGHATRIIPIIQQLLNWNASVMIGGDGRSFQLLKEEFPHLKAIELPAYNVKYTGNAAMVAITLIRTPNYLLAIKQEHDALQQIVKNHQIDFVISDNRYGLWTNLVPTIFICHQIALIPPKYFEWGSLLAYRLHRYFIDQFNHIWIPDFDGEQHLTGKLTTKYPLTNKMAYIGALSRFSTAPKAENIEHLSPIDIVCVLSGPEPQRTLLEYELLKSFDGINRQLLIVQGKTEQYEIHQNKNVKLVSYLTSKVLNTVLQKANVIVARSGYSTIMDLATLGKKAILIPTPGQTEQEYLAKKLSAEGKVVMRQQSDLNIESALIEIERIDGFTSVQFKNELQSEMIRVFNPNATSKY
jgi:uncharacterized protein (TIGR00661 family)